MQGVNILTNGKTVSYPAGSHDELKEQIHDAETPEDFPICIFALRRFNHIIEYDCQQEETLCH